MKTKISISKRNLLLFGLPVLGLVLGLLGNFALVAPQKSQAQRLDAQLQTAQAQLVASQQKPAVTPTPTKAPKPQSVQAADIFRLTKAMPDSNDMPGILLHLSQLARASAVTLTSVTPTARVPLTQGYGALPLSVVITGKFDQVAGFLQHLRQQAAIGKNGPAERRRAALRRKPGPDDVERRPYGVGDAEPRRLRLRRRGTRARGRGADRCRREHPERR